MDEIVSCPHCGTKNRVKIENMSKATCGNCKLPISKNYYEILEVNKHADQDEIKKAYRKQAIKWHPDTHIGDKSVAEARFKLISAAYTVLSDENKRQQYDMFLNQSSQSQTNNKTYQEPEVDYETAAKMFFDEMYSYGMRMAMANMKIKEIYPNLVKVGCPENIAKVIAQQCIQYRKSFIRPVALKLFIKSFIWFAIGGLITLFTYNSASGGGTYLVAYGPMIYGGYNALRAVYYIITGKTPLPKENKKSFYDIA